MASPIIDLLHPHALLLALAVFIAIYSLRQRITHGGLPVWPVVGMMPSLILAAIRGNLFDWITDILRQQGGTFRFIGPTLSNINSVLTSDPRNVEHILKTRFSNYPKGEYHRTVLGDLLGDGIFNADDEAWQRQRRMASLEFHSAKFRKLTVESLIELVHRRLLPVLEGSVHDDHHVNSNDIFDMQDLLLRITFDNVCMVAFGVDPGCSLGVPEVPFARAFEDATEASALRFLIPTCLWRAMRCLDIGSERKLRRSIQVVNKFADEVIQARKKEIITMDQIMKDMDDGDHHHHHSNSNSIDQRLDLLTVFTRMKDEEGSWLFTDKFLRDMCINLILAGRDTSSVALCWFFWLLDEHPAVEERILEEIYGIVGERGEEVAVMDAGNADARVGVVFRPEEVKQMEYLQAAIFEALRLYPSVPMDHKEVVEDDVFPDGTAVKKGTYVIYAIYAMGRMEAIWGKDCREYRPERWLRDDDGRFTNESPYKFPSFNGGPRLCLGKDFAHYQMKFIAASIIYRYRVKVVKAHPVAPKLALTLYMKHGLKVQLVRRHPPAA